MSDRCVEELRTLRRVVSGARQQRHVSVIRPTERTPGSDAILGLKDLEIDCRGYDSRSHAPDARCERLAHEDGRGQSGDDPGDNLLPSDVAVAVAAVEGGHDGDVPLHDCDRPAQAVVSVHQVDVTFVERSPESSDRAEVVEAA
ncbi:MAG: hypothetical protein OEW31_11645, partial [Thermoleophilia bacterium]|nr:hypothetical protein [Thermoleophilia bacterium]